jgi:hypothetical protein
MKKLLSTALILTALPFTLDGVTPAVSKAHAIVGRPLTPMSVAGVHRRAVRRTFGVGANLGYRGYYHRNFGPYAYNRWGYGYHPVARAAVYGAGWRRSWNRPLYAYAGPAYRPVARAAVYGAGVYGAGWGGGWGVGAGIGRSMRTPVQPIVRLLAQRSLARPLTARVGAAAGEVGVGIGRSTATRVWAAAGEVGAGIAHSIPTPA